MIAVRHTCAAALTLTLLAFAQPAAAQQTGECAIRPLPTEGALSAADVKLLNESLRCIGRRLERLEAAAKTTPKKYGMLRTETIDGLIVALESVRFSEDGGRVISQWTIRNTRQEPTQVMVDAFKSAVSIQGVEAPATPRVQEFAACDVSYIDSTEQCAKRKAAQWTVVRPGSWDSFRILTADEVHVTEERSVTFKVRFIVRKSEKDWFFRDVVFDDVTPAPTKR